MRIHLLGTGTPTPSLRRMCSGYVVRAGGSTIVFDHGFGAHHRLLELGIAPTEVTHAFLSHDVQWVRTRAGGEHQPTLRVL